MVDNMNIRDINIFKKVKTDHSVKKTFNYTSEGVQLAFTLRVDIKKELKSFKELLLQALKEVEEEITR